MPVLRQHDMVELADQPVDSREDRVAVCHGELAARAKIVLHVDDDQCLAAHATLHWHPERPRS